MGRKSHIRMRKTVVETRKTNERQKKDINGSWEKREEKLRVWNTQISGYTDVHTPIHMVLLD